MVEKQRPRSGSKYSLKPQIAAVLSSLPPLGYKVPPTLIGAKTISSDALALRARNYTKAYKTLSIKDWNSYVVFGIQQFASPSKYLTTRDSESTNERNLRLGRYYRLHLENHVPVDKALMSQIVGIEAALQTSFPGYFDMSIVEMDEYLMSLDPTDLHSPDTSLNLLLPLDDTNVQQQDTAMPNASSPITSPNRRNDVPRFWVGGPVEENTQHPTQSASTSTGDIDKKRKSSLKKNVVFNKTSDSPIILEAKPNDQAPTVPTALDDQSSFIHPLLPVSSPPRKSLKIPTIVVNSIRVEVRWAPKDFKELKASTAQLYLRLAPILSVFNSSHSWIIEWQTEQLATSKILEPASLTKFLSIRVMPSVKQQCFYFSFRVNATGSQFTQVVQSREMQDIKKGENISFDPSFIPANQGEITNVGDILLKDATTTHRSQYLQYLRTEVLPPDMPAFDLKLRHKDPSGVKTQILTVRCGRQVATQVAQSLSAALNGEGSNPEIFISRLALGANRIARGDHEAIYKVHHEYMSDIVYLPFPVNKKIDSEIVEYLETGDQITRTPRQWAKSLTFPDKVSLEVDMESGTSDGATVLIIPSASLEHAQTELNNYLQRQNPTLMNAERFYSESVLADPDIPLTVFTRNIEKILAKKIHKKQQPVDSSDSVLSPESSITGMTSKTSRSSSNAWKRPLKKSVSSSPASTAAPTVSVATANEIQQQQRIVMLEAQLASLSAGNSKASGEKSQLSGDSPNSLATAHARLDGIESAVLNIQTMLQKMHTSNRPDQCTQQSDRATWPTLPGRQLFPEEYKESGLQLVLLSPTSSPSKKQQNPKRRKAPSSPSTDSNLHKNETMGSSGDDSC